MRLDAKAKKILKKEIFANVCGYVYTDGFIVKYTEKHTHKGKEYNNDIVHKIPGEIPVYYSNGTQKKFEGRLVFHNPTLLLDGIKSIRIYLNNSSENMKNMSLTCTTITIETESGLKIHEDQFHFLSSDITIQDDSKRSIESW